jgi:glutathione S-transferase
MSLTLYYHPLASFCHKVPIALYENETPFTAEIVDLGNAEESARFLDLWPVGKIPVLRDDRLDRTLPETTIIIEHIDRHYSGAQPLLPRDETERLDTRLWDRFFDLYVQVPMQKVVTDRLRPDGEHDPRGVADARDALATAYGMLEGGSPTGPGRRAKPSASPTARRRRLCSMRASWCRSLTPTRTWRPISNGLSRARPLPGSSTRRGHGSGISPAGRPCWRDSSTGTAARMLRALRS